MRTLLTVQLGTLVYHPFTTIIAPGIIFQKEPLVGYLKLLNNFNEWGTYLIQPSRSGCNVRVLFMKLSFEVYSIRFRSGL